MSEKHVTAQDIERFEGSRMCFARVGSFFLVVHTKDTPGDAEWQKYLDAARRVPAGERMPTLVFTDGGAPTKPQREGVLAVLKGHDAPVAVVSPSAAIRFVISSLALFGMKIKSYAPNEWRTAFSHLKLENQAACEQAMAELWQSSFAPQCAMWTSARSF